MNLLLQFTRINKGFQQYNFSPKALFLLIFSFLATLYVKLCILVNPQNKSYRVTIKMC